MIVTATDNSATPAVSGSATLTQECVSRSSDGGAPRRGSRSVLATEALNRNTCGSAIAFNIVGAFLGGTEVTGGLTIAYYGFQGSKTAPLLGTVAFFGGVALAAYGVSTVNAAHHALTDPPDPHFRSLVAVRPVRLSKFHARRGLSARAAKALNSYLAEISKAAAVAGTMATTIDRAGGAIAAANPEWEGRQIRYAIALANTFKADVTTLSKDARSLSRSAKGSSALTGRLPIAKLRALQQAVAKHGVPARLVRFFRRYGITASQLRAALKGKLSKRLPRTMLQFLTGPATLAEFNNAAKAFLAWSKASQIIAESQLK